MAINLNMQELMEVATKRGLCVVNKYIVVAHLFRGKKKKKARLSQKYFSSVLGYFSSTS
jgi:hypothetical protein